jgi:serine/threonine protein kinase
VEGTPFGRYRLTELLGRGGMGEVWRAHDTEIDRVVALKTLLPQFAQDRLFEQRFRREARAAARLDDPHIVPIYDVGEIDGRLYVTMRLINGLDLQTLLDGGPLEPGRAVGIIEQVASALNAAHDVGLVHRDVKPSNVLLGKDDFAYLIDFGIARTADETALTSTGAAVGTWSYMAPERFNDGRIEASSDIYALACVLYQCLTGQRPFSGATLEQVAMAHMLTPPPRPSVRQQGIPAAMDQVIATGLAKDPDGRYSSTVEMARAARDVITIPSPRPQSVLAPDQPTEQMTPEAPDTLGQQEGPARPSGVSSSAPTQQRSGVKARFPEQKPPSRSPRGKRVLWGGIAAGVAATAVVAATIAMIVPSSRDSSPTATSLTGTYTADVGQELDVLGKPRDGAPYSEKWRMRSVCRASGCVATALTGGQFPLEELVFDDVGGRWLSVVVSEAKCDGVDGERFDVVSLQPGPAGTLTGEWATANSQGSCTGKRTVTFTRDGDTDLGDLPDPASLPPRVVSPAEALHGRYRREVTYPDGSPVHEPGYNARTDCLRTGERCVSVLANKDAYMEVLIFGNGAWTRNSEFDFLCSAGGTSHVKITAEFPFPQPPQDPITLLTGHGHEEESGAACESSDFDEKLVRTGG